MNFDYYFAAACMTIFSSCALIVLITSNCRMIKTKKYFFSASILLLIFAALAEYYGVFFNGYPEKYRFIHIALKVFELSVSPVMVICMVSALNSFKRAKKIVPIALINVILQVISGFNGFMYYFDANNIYHHNTFYGIYTAIYVICIMMFFTECVRFSRKYQNRNLSSVLSILIFIALGLSIHIIFSDIRVDWLAIAIAHNLSYSYYNALAEQMDSLTKLLDRKSYDVHIASLKKKTVIIMFDIDRFKLINDTFGHDEGDIYLRIVADEIKKVYSRYGLCYRIGGDEFCAIIKRDCSISELNHTFNSQISVRHGKLSAKPPEVSLGYAVFDPKKQSALESVKEADLMLYNKKRKRKLSLT